MTRKFFLFNLLLIIYSSSLYAETYHLELINNSIYPINITNDRHCITTFNTQPGGGEVKQIPGYGKQKIKVSTRSSWDCFYRNHWVKLYLHLGNYDGSPNSDFLGEVANPVSIYMLEPEGLRRMRISAYNPALPAGFKFLSADRQVILDGETARLTIEPIIPEDDNNRVELRINNQTQNPIADITPVITVRAPYTDDMIEFSGKKTSVNHAFGITTDFKTQETNRDVAPTRYLEGQVYSEIVDAFIDLPSGKRVSCDVRPGFEVIPAVNNYKQPILHASLMPGFLQGIDGSCLIDGGVDRRVNAKIEVVDSDKADILVTHVDFVMTQRSGKGDGKKIVFSSPDLKKYPRTLPMSGSYFTTNDWMDFNLEKALVYNVYHKIDRVRMEVDGLMIRCTIDQGNELPLERPASLSTAGIHVGISYRRIGGRTCHVKVGHHAGFVNFEQDNRFQGKSNVVKSRLQAIFNPGEDIKITDVIVFARDLVSKVSIGYRADFDGVLTNSFVDVPGFYSMSDKKSILKHHLYNHIHAVQIKSELEGTFMCNVPELTDSVIKMPPYPFAKLQLSYLGDKKCALHWVI